MKRMFSDDVIFSDTVTGLSHKGFALYIILMLLADDDGFINKLRIAITIANVESDTITELIDSGLVLEVDSSVYVITDWLIHNNIDSRAYKRLAPLELRSKVRVSPSGRYTTDRNGFTIDEYRKSRTSKWKPSTSKIAVYNNLAEDGITPNPNKVICGCHSNIELSEGELKALHEQLGEQANSYINQLSNYVAETGDYSIDNYKSTLVLAELSDDSNYSVSDISQKLHVSFEEAIENAF